MNPRAKELIGEMRKLQAESVIDGMRFHTHQVPLMAELQVNVAESQEKSAETLEHYTRTLIRLTWGLVSLAIVLLVLTVVFGMLHQRPHL
jgi:hypothetical protein